MNIYFACAITGGRDFESVYQTITRALLEDGHTVPTAHLAESSIVALEKIAQPLDIYSRDTAWIQESDVLVAEISTPSHGVGYEIGFALNLGKPVLCCYQQEVNISKMLTGNPDQLLTIKAYQTAEEAVQITREYLSEISQIL